MAVQFMTGTPEEDLERLMQAVPGFRARKSGFAVSRGERSKSYEKICQRKAELSELTLSFALEIGEKNFDSPHGTDVCKAPGIFLPAWP